MAEAKTFDRVLILGAKGMLGQALNEGFADVQPLAWDRAELDIADEQAVREAFQKIKPTLIINAAAYNAVDEAETHEDAANRVNGDAPGFLAESSKRLGATFIHYSTDYVFDGARAEGYAEVDLPNSVSAYGRSKRLGEERVMNVRGSSYLIRTSRLFGNRGRGAGTKESFVDLMLRLSSEREEIDLVNEELSSPTYVVDLALATRILLEEGNPFGIYHRTGDGACTWYGFAQEIFRITGWRGTIHPVPRSRFPQPAARPAFSTLKSTKLPPLRTWQAALAEYLQTIRI